MNKIFLLLFTSILLFGAQPKFLMPDEAFKPSVKLNDKMQVEATVNTAKDIYLYVVGLVLGFLMDIRTSKKTRKSPDMIPKL